MLKPFKELALPCFFYEAIIRCPHIGNIYSLLLNISTPNLKYAVQASSPHLKKNIDHLERLRRLATHMVKDCRGLSYE